MKENRARDERLQIMLTPEELVAVDDFRFKKRMPSSSRRGSGVAAAGACGRRIRPRFSGCQVNGFWCDWRRPESDAKKF